MRPWHLAAVLLFALAACSDAPRIERPVSPSTVGAVHADLPAPEGFRYMKNVSNTSPTGAFRVVNQNLEGPNRRVEDAAKFFHDVYPRHGWTLEAGDAPGGAGVTLSFVKKAERCTLFIRNKSRGLVSITLKVNRK